MIPLSQRSGLLEWCEGTVSIGDYLVGATSAPNDGAHSRYHHSDWSNSECKRKMMSVSDIMIELKHISYVLCRLLKQRREQLNIKRLR